MVSYAKKNYYNGGRVYGMYDIIIDGEVVDTVERSLRFNNGKNPYIMYKNKKLVVR